MDTFSLNWYAGPSTQVELFSPQAGATGPYQLKYTPPMRTTIRSIQDLNLGNFELQPLNAQMEALVTALNARSSAGAGDEAAVTAAPEAEMRTLGDLLLNLIIPPYIQADLRTPELFIEMGMDDVLLGYPWELMHDGDNYLCLKHFVGRFVNSATSAPLRLSPTRQWGMPLQPLKVLIIAVPRPLPYEGEIFDPLPQAEQELNAIVETLTKIPEVRVELLRDLQATYNNVYQKLKEPWHIIHFCGHGQFDNQEPRNSRLILHNRPISTGAINTFVAKAQPILCFVNACESAMTPVGAERLNVYGLGRAFLETGAYLLGSRWKIGDTLATKFASTFYTSLLAEGCPLGKAVQDARIACYDEDRDDFAWASYTLYGDPRVCFQQ